LRRNNDSVTFFLMFAYCLLWNLILIFPCMIVGGQTSRVLEDDITGVFFFNEIIGVD